MSSICICVIKTNILLHGYLCYYNPNRKLKITDFNFVPIWVQERKIHSHSSAITAKKIWESLERKEKYYTVFIDFTKAFDLLDRALIYRKLEETLGRDSVWTRVIDSIIKWNKIRISDNLDISEPIIQTNGVLQGDPLSPLLFILATEEIMEITQKEDVTAYAYADDIVIGSKSLKKLQNTIDEVEKWCTQHKFKINMEKTEMMVFI